MILRLSKQFVSVGIYVIMGLVTIKKGMSVSLFCSEICQGRSIVLISRFLRIFSAVFNKRSYCFSYFRRFLQQRCVASKHVSRWYSHLPQLLHYLFLSHFCMK